MKISMNWIRQYADIPVSPAEYESTMIMHGTGVEGIEYAGRGMPERGGRPGADLRVIMKTATICTCARWMWAAGRAAADRLRRAQRARAASLVPVASIGAHAARRPRNQKGQAARRRKSDGMLCSGAELGVPMELYPCRRRRMACWFSMRIIPLGADVQHDASAWTITVVDFEILANRPDCLCAWGIARETAAALGTELDAARDRRSRTSAAISPIMFKVDGGGSRPAARATPPA